MRPPVYKLRPSFWLLLNEQNRTFQVQSDSQSPCLT
uniref:Uncharacterized protein n=1 Tax=Anguilla anguilla TaxID=7936 RepID=A0A0E9XQG7_ANGAN